MCCADDADDAALSLLLAAGCCWPLAAERVQQDGGPSRGHSSAFMMDTTPLQGRVFRHNIAVARPIGKR
jgi:hypothetical protein